MVFCVSDALLQSSQGFGLRAFCGDQCIFLNSSSISDSAVKRKPIVKIIFYKLVKVLCAFIFINGDYIAFGCIKYRFCVSTCAKCSIKIKSAIFGLQYIQYFFPKGPVNYVAMKGSVIVETQIAVGKNKSITNVSVEIFADGKIEFAGSDKQKKEMIRKSAPDFKFQDNDEEIPINLQSTRDSDGG